MLDPKFPSTKFARRQNTMAILFQQNTAIKKYNIYSIHNKNLHLQKKMKKQQTINKYY